MTDRERIVRLETKTEHIQYMLGAIFLAMVGQWFIKSNFILYLGSMILFAGASYGVMIQIRYWKKVSKSLFIFFLMISILMIIQIGGIPLGEVVLGITRGVSGICIAIYTWNRLYKFNQD